MTTLSDEVGVFARGGRAVSVVGPVALPGATVVHRLLGRAERMSRAVDEARAEAVFETAVGLPL